MSLLLEIPFSEKQIEKNDICFTVLNIVERIDLGKYIEFSKGRPTSYDIDIKYSILREPNIDYMIELDEGLDQWLNEVNAVKKGRELKMVHPSAQQDMNSHWKMLK